MRNQPGPTMPRRNIEELAPAWVKEYKWGYLDFQIIVNPGGRRMFKIIFFLENYL